MHKRDVIMTQPEKPKIEFPCKDYPVKVVCRTESGFREFVLQTMIRHAPGFDESRVKMTDSKNGKFCSITVYIIATGMNQLSQLNDDLQKDSRVMMVI